MIPAEKSALNPVEEELELRTVALQNAASIRQARQRAEDELIRAKQVLELRTAELARSLAMMRATLEATSNAILAVDANGTITEFNQNFLDMWRLRRDVVAAASYPRLLEGIAAAFAGDAPAFLDTVRSIETSSQAESFDLLELTDGRIVERFSKLQVIDGVNVGRVWSFRDITAQKRGEAALLESETTLRATFNQAAVGVMIAGLDGGFLDVNQRFAQILGYSRDELIGRSFAELTHGPDLAESEARVASLLRDEIPEFALEKRYVRKDGSTVWSHTTVTLRRDGSGRPTSFIGVIEDISARKEAELALQEETRALELLNQTGAVLASSLDLETLMQAATDAATQLSEAQFGAFFYAVSDADGDTFRLYTLSGASREDFEKFGDPRTTPLLEPTFRGKGPIRCDDVLKDPRYGQMEPHAGMPLGHLRVRSYLAVPVVSRSSEVIGGLFFGHSEVGVFSERTERVVLGIAAQAAIAIDNARLFSAAQKAAEERKLLLERERSARAHAERMGEVKDEFLATLSHELRTPLSAILGWAYVLRSSKADEDQLRQGLETIERNARIQTQLIEDLLDMSRITSGKVRLDIQPLDPVSFIDAALETVKPAADAKGIRIEKLLNPVAGRISGDPSRLQQVVWNLLSNAIKFTPPDGRVQVRLDRVNAHIEINIADTGMGIKPEFIAHVFERFKQADASTTRRYGGLGLGLAIVKHLVELHGGTVQATSAGEGRGATFTVQLPVTGLQRRPDVGNRMHAQAPNAVPLPLKPLDLSGLRILVVDDESDARELIKHILVESKAEVLLAGSASEAIALVERERPDLLISDIGMPDVDGFELIKRVRALGETRGGRVPAIALTAFARPEDGARAYRAGFRVHVSKPVEPSELLATVASLAGRPA